mmetsp:Transcript_4267/g.10707  ORF Transcript_4267/g.10707 Transcript_4267/m.10707 type:complete len:226 (+) Transcript_4267:1341-2018(+)
MIDRSVTPSIRSRLRGLTPSGTVPSRLDVFSILDGYCISCGSLSTRLCCRHFRGVNSKNPISCSRACRPLVSSALHAPPRTRPSLVLAAGAGGACSKGLTGGAISGNFPGDTSEADTLRADFCWRQGSVGFGLGFGLRRLVASGQLRDDRGGVQRRHRARRSRSASAHLQQRALCEHAAGRRARRGRCSRLCLAALLHALWAQPAQGHTGAGAAPKASCVVEVEA